MSEFLDTHQQKNLILCLYADNLLFSAAGEVAVDRKHSKIYYPQSRQQLYGVRPTNNVSFISDISKNGRKSNRTASNAYTPPSQLQKVAILKNLILKCIF